MDSAFFDLNHKYASPQISDVGPLRTTYRDVQDVYLDYNHISSLDVLEDAYWLNNFRVFSLKGNKLTSVR